MTIGHTFLFIKRNRWRELRKQKKYKENEIKMIGIM